MSVLQRLIALTLVLPAFAWAQPCLLAPLLSSHETQLQASAAHHGGGGSAGHDLGAASEGHGAHHEQPDCEPSAELNAACPCGCDGSAPSASSGGRLGYALIPAPCDERVPLSLALVPPTVFSIAEGEALSPDHVPIPS